MKETGRYLGPVVFAMIYPTLTAWFYFVLLAPPSDTLPPGWLPLTAYAAGKVVQFGLPLFWVFGLERSTFVISRPRADGLAWGIGFGFLVMLAMFVLYFWGLRGSALFEQTPAKIAAKLELFHAATPARFLLLAVFLSVIHSFLEEYYWRWFVFGELRKISAPPLAVLLSSLAFMGHHVIILSVYFPGRFLTLAVPFSLCIAVGGAVWAIIYERSGSLVAPWISHMLVDAGIFVVGYNMIFS
jgi:membrane protease YdiL (CAAX protease family)